MSSTTARALSGYRRLFRARNKLFQGDVRALAESRLAIRAEFDKNRIVPDASHLEGLLVMIDEAEDMMLHGIVQGSLNERGNYEVKVKAEHADTEDTAATMEPITSKTVDRMTGAPPKVEITKSKPSS
mmetsp:Transcript_13133/g.21789  ORF Transcript_13133/g.21789 Transcript_13133/m.21789 type:complete len:128 (-) Transcript_13133:137-520(-)